MAKWQKIDETVTHIDFMRIMKDGRARFRRLDKKGGAMREFTVSEQVAKKFGYQKQK